MSFPVWLVGWFCFVLLHIIHLSSLSSRMPLSHSLLFAAPRCSGFFENATFGGPEFTMTLLFLAVVMSLLFCGHNLCNSLICSWAWWAFPLRLWLLPVRVNKVAITQVQSPFPPSVALLRLQLLVSPAQPSAATETKDRGGELGQNFLNPTEHCLPCRTLLPLGDAQKGKARIWTQFSQLHQLYANE